jgi:hypothetical protein
MAQTAQTRLGAQTHPEWTDEAVARARGARSKLVRSPEVDGRPVDGSLPGPGMRGSLRVRASVVWCAEAPGQTRGV